MRNCALSTPKHTDSQFMMAGSEGLQWKLVWRRTWALPTKWHCQMWYRARSVHVIVHDAGLNTVIRSFSEGLRWKSHEGGHGHCPWNDIIHNKMTCMWHTSSRFSGGKFWLELSDLDKSLHEGGHSCYRQNDIVRFGITHMQRPKRAKMCLTVYGGQK